MSDQLEVRQKLLESYIKASVARDAISEQMYSEDYRGGLDEEFERIQKEIDAITEEYTNILPAIPVSRCPYTNTVTTQRIDAYGLDGLWWNYDAPSRKAEPFPETWFAFTGALKLYGALENFSFLCVPGPEKPFVLPRILNQPEMKAVISSLKIGNHIAYMINYFSHPMIYGIERINDWGTDSYSYENESGDAIWDSCDIYESDCDFDLAAWLRAGKLFWIAPDDDKLVLRQGVDDCPYIGLEGRTSVSYISKGEVWW